MLREPSHNVTNTPSFDTPNNNVSFADGNNPPTFAADGFQAAGQLGDIQNPIGSPRLIRMAIHVTF